jgi:hypothetical protein
MKDKNFEVFKYWLHWRPVKHTHLNCYYVYVSLSNKPPGKCGNKFHHVSLKTMMITAQGSDQ